MHVYVYICMYVCACMCVQKYARLHLNSVSSPTYSFVVCISDTYMYITRFQKDVAIVTMHNDPFNALCMHYFIIASAGDKGSTSIGAGTTMETS